LFLNGGAITVIGLMKARKTRHPPLPETAPPGEFPRWQRRPAERRREILDAAVRVFGERGFDCATIADVAREAGVSAGTVVHYFGSKGDLFEEALRDRFLEEVAGGEALLAAHHETYRELLIKLLDRMWHHLMQPGTADLMLFGLVKATSFPGACEMMCREVGDRWRRLLAGVISGGIKNGEFRPVDVSLQARVLASSLSGLVLAASHFAPFESNPPSSDRLLAQYLETVDHALAARPAVVSGRPGSDGP
jgi:AcrR family transcriptional regulator